ncbi:hypothetical protein Q8G71_34315, partial [Klebsiella pneumoniae]
YNAAQVGEGVEDLQRCKEELNVLFSRKKMMWKQRSKAIWIREGDRNTRFFHSLASARRNRNLISGIRDCMGQWRTNFPEIEGELVGYFRDIF